MSSSLLVKRLVLGVLLLAVFAGSVQALCEATGGAKCYYIDPVNGNDANNGLSEAQPFLRPQLAVKLVGPGDYIYLRGGTYTAANAYVTSGVCGTAKRKLFDVGFVNVPACISETGSVDTYSVRSGTPTARITVKSYPGERAYIQRASQISIGSNTISSMDVPAAYWTFQDLTIEGTEFFITGGSKGSGNARISQTHDIIIRDSELFNRTAPGGTNVGLIKIYRGDWGGPYNIYIWNNVMHDLQDANQPGPWNTTTDWQHFGSVAVESCPTYLGAACGGNGYIEIINNTIYNVPAVFFFKNPMPGPIVIRSNIMYNARNFGRWGSANMLVERNVFYRAGGGADLGQFGGTDASPGVAALSGQNITIQYNTFVSGGFGSLSINGSGHTSRYNVFASSMGNAQGATGSTASVYTRNYADGAGSYYWPDTGGASAALSQLNVGNNFNDNCFVAGNNNPLIAKRFYPTAPYTVPTSTALTGPDYTVQLFNWSQAQQTFGFETRSVLVIEPNKANVFVDPANDDYHLLTSGPIAACANMGAYANGNGPPPPPPPVCGNGVREGSEQCDLGPGNGACPSTCTAGCTTQTCQPVPKTGDLNNDGKVDVSDILLVLQKLGQTGVTIPEDLNADHAVDVLDLVLLARQWG